jgi:proteic killer suppression protein
MGIKSFQHKGLQTFFEKGSKAGIQPTHADKLARLLSRLHMATVPEDMNLPGFGFHGLKGDLSGHYAVCVNGNWRVTFKFEGADAILLDYVDYH